MSRPSLSSLLSTSMVEDSPLTQVSVSPMGPSPHITRFVSPKSSFLTSERISDVSTTYQTFLSLSHSSFYFHSVTIVTGVIFSYKVLLPVRTTTVHEDSPVSSLPDIIRNTKSRPPVTTGNTLDSLSINFI